MLSRPPLRKLAHGPGDFNFSLFCGECPDRERCGGMAPEFGGGDCYDFCCGGEPGCQTPCRKNPAYPAQVREIDGFDLATIPRTPPVFSNGFHGLAPMIMHGYGRDKPVQTPIVAIKLRTLIDFNRGVLKFETREQLAAKLKFEPSARLVVTGVEQDCFIEPWWSLGRARRAPLLKEMARFGLDLATPPNFSLFSDQPRTSDFNAMKRIGWVQYEFLDAGIPCALHAHIRNENDANAWANYVADRPEMTIISYEFATGAGQKHAMPMHVDHLIRLTEVAGRPLDLVLKGGLRAMPELSQAFRNTLYVDTDAFMKATCRRKLVEKEDGGLDSIAVRTPRDLSLVDLFQHNVDQVARVTRNQLVRVS